METDPTVVSRNRPQRRFTYSVVIVCITAFLGSTGASAQITGSPVNPAGEPTWSGQPYVKTHKRHDKNFYGKHYNVFKHSKR